MKWFASIIIAILGIATVQAQNYEQELEKQRRMFPQEKVYVTTDRDLYLAGDTARMRAWIYDCNSKKPESQSKYLYVELRDAANNLKVRVKLLNRTTSSNAQLISGYLALPPTLSSGDYTLAAYTYYMLGTTEEMFFRKRLHVMNPKDVARGLLPVNLMTELSEVTTDTDLRKAVPVGANVAISITSDRLCRADSTSSITWSLANQPDLFTKETIAQTGKLYSPTMPYEGGQIISGTVYGNISTKKVQPNIRVSMVIPSKKYTDVCITDLKGRFMFKGFDLPDSTLVFISAKKGKRTRMDNIKIDGDSLPELITALPATPHYFKRADDVPSEMKIISNTIDLSNTQLLDEITVKGEKKERVTETYQNLASRTMVADELMNRGIYDLETALMHMPGIQMNNGVLSYRGKPLRFFIDGIEETDDYDDASIPSVGSMVAMSYPMEIIQRIDFIRPEDAAFLMGGAGLGNMAAVCITLKDGADIRRTSRSSSLKFVWPLGYQRNKRFYPPAPDTAWPVIYWKPNITVKDTNEIARRVSSVMRKRREAGDRGSYTVHIDGFTAEGKPFHLDYNLKTED